MPAPTLVFSHANGFPAGTYKQLFKAWREAGYRVKAVERFGHDPRYPVTSNWPRLRDQLIDFIDAEVGGPVDLVGHSLGGLLSLMVAIKRPDLARGLVMLDSPVFTGWRAHSVHMLKASGLMHRFSPAKVAQARRYDWPSRRAVAEHYGAKALFARWHPQVLADYIACGTEPDPAGGVRLAFHRDIETRLYNTLPHHLGPLLRKHPPGCPVAFIGGTKSEEIRRAGLAATKAATHGRLSWVEGTHLFPMEKPAATAAAVLLQLTAKQ